MRNEVRDWTTNPLAWIGFLIIAQIIVAVLAIATYGEGKKEFMAECLLDHKKYECQSMWKGNSHL